MPTIMSTTAFTASNGIAVVTSAAPHRKNAAGQNQSESPHWQRTSRKDNPTQQLIKQAVDHLIRQLEAGKSETLTAYLGAMARFHSYFLWQHFADCQAAPHGDESGRHSRMERAWPIRKKGRERYPDFRTDHRPSPEEGRG